MHMLLFYVPCRDSEEAASIGAELIRRRLVACTSTFPVSSSFFWEGELRSEEETVLLAKTLEDKEKEVRDAIVSLHSYDVPAILVWRAESGADYEAWMKGCIG